MLKRKRIRGHEIVEIDNLVMVDWPERLGVEAASASRAVRARRPLGRRRWRRARSVDQIP